METILRDARQALRSLRVQPAFAWTAILTVALGVGATTAIFSVLNVVLLTPLPYADSERLGTIWADLRARDVVDFPIAPADFADMRRSTSSFSDLAAVFSFRPALGGDGRGDAEQISAATVTTNTIDLLGYHVSLGRGFIADDGAPLPDGQTDVPVTILLSHEFWQRRYGADASVVGRIVEFNTGRALIAGVLDPGVELLFPPGTNIEPRPDVLVANRTNFETAPRNNGLLRVIGKLRSGVRFRQAQEDLDRVSADLRQRFAVKQGSNQFFRIEPMRGDLVADIRPQLVLLTGGVLLVLFIACANVANLLLVRAAGRQPELALRVALGASRLRMIGQMTVEALVLALIGGGAGLLIAQAGIDGLIALAPPTLPRLHAVAIDVRVLIFALTVSASAALAFGLVPAWRASRIDAIDSLRAAGRIVGASDGRWLRDGAVVVEVAFAFVLLVGSGLVLRTFANLRDTNPGFDSTNVMTFTVQNQRNRSAEERQIFQRQMLERLRALPGIVDATAAGPLPLDGGIALARYGTPEALVDASKFRQAVFHFVEPGFFAFSRTPIIAGRAFSEDDNRPGRKVIVIDDILAAKLFPDRDPIGQRMVARVTTDEPDTFEVIGVAGHQRHTTMMDEGREGMYFTDGYAGFGRAGRYAVRAERDPSALVPGIRGAIGAQDPRLVMAEVRPWRSFVDQAIAPTRFMLVLIGCYAIAALGLAAIGLYGVLATNVRQRATEIALRFAFGADRRVVMRSIVTRGLLLTAIGIAIGVIAAASLQAVVMSMLVGVKPSDPETYVATMAVLTIVAAAAAWVPAYRAARIDPIVTLRSE